MKSTRLLARISVIFGALVLAACETTAPDSRVEQPSDTAAEASQEQAASQGTPQPEAIPDTDERAAARADATTPDDGEDFTSGDAAANDGASVAVFIADFNEQEGWHPVPLESGHLYINPEPVILRDDLTGIQAGKSEDDEGLLALSLTNEGQERVTDATTQYPDMRLALIVGNTLLAAPGYSEPVVNEHLIFAVGTEENAVAVARAIAGVDEDDPGVGAGSEPASWD